MTQNTKDNAFRDKVVYGVLAALIIFVAQKFMEPHLPKSVPTPAPIENTVAINEYNTFLKRADRELKEIKPDYLHAKKLYNEAISLAKNHKFNYKEATKGLTKVEHELKELDKSISVKVKPNDASSATQEVRKTTYSLPSVSDNMVFIEGGIFQIKCYSNLHDSRDFMHQISLEDYYISAYEVTFDEYDHYCNETGQRLPSDEGWGRNKRPVINVSWYDAINYCNWSSRNEGLQTVYSINGEHVTVDFHANGYRLPTEVEWEYAARDQGNNTTWAGTDSGSVSGDNIVKYANLFNQKDGYDYTAPVGSFHPNELGLFNMNGNVCEWSSDCWTTHPYNPINTVKDLNIILECVDSKICGSFWGQPYHISGIFGGSQGTNHKEIQHKGIGFRIAKSFTSRSDNDELDF